MIYLLHHLTAAVLGALLIAVLLRGRWPHRAPASAIALWHCGLLSVWIAAAGLAFGPVVIIHDRGIIPALVQAVREGVGLAAAVPGLIFVAASLTVIILSWLRMGRQRRRLRRLLDLIGETTDWSLPAVRIDSATPTVWCLPGLRPKIVITSATAAVLTEAELAAVLRHERAHLRQRHDLALLPFRAVRTFLPHSRLAAAMHRKVQQLTEMLADDHALRTSRPSDLARALTVLGGVDVTAAPDGALGVADEPTTTAARIARLRRPRHRLRWRIVLVLLAAGATLLATPASLFLLPG